MFTILLFVLILSLLVFVHELGHFLTARRLGVAVEEFGFGFPPKLVGIRRGSTLYSINWIPFGGFVKLKGENGEETVTPDSFAAASAPKRAAILLAGVIMNFVLSVVLLGIALGIGVPSTRDGLLPGGTLKDVAVTVVEVLSDSPAASAGLTTGDKIIRINELAVTDDEMVRTAIAEQPDQVLALDVRRAGQIITLTPTPRNENGTGRLGVALETIGTATYPPQWAAVNGARVAGELAGQVVTSFGDFLNQLIVRQKLSPDVSGPIGIAVLTGQVSKLGFTAVLQFIAILSLSLAVINALPFPALDGGRVLFLLIEKVRGRTMRPQVEGWIHNAGFILLLLFIAVVSIKDVQRFQVVRSVAETVSGWFR